LQLFLKLKKKILFICQFPRLYPVAFFLTYSISYFIPSFPLSLMLFWMLALCFSASVSLQSHEMWSTVSLTLLVVILLVYDVSVRCQVSYLEITTWSRLFIFFVSLFHSISFLLFFKLFSLFCHVVFLVFLSFVLI
jgi:hypothetical protein